MRSFPEEFYPLLSVAAAVLDEDGLLVEANAGFLRLLPGTGGSALGADASWLFIQPTFKDLATAARGDAEGYRGFMTLGEVGGKVRTLRGYARAGGETLVRILAEYDVAGQEQLTDAMMGLNEESSVARHALARSNVELRQREVLVLESSLTDELTGVGNRRKLDEALAVETSRVAREGGSLCIIMADLDHFKLVNDTYGHAAGDKVLAAFGAMLRSMTRKTDVVARYGGEEFVVLLPHTTIDKAALKAEALGKALRAMRVHPLPEGVTASFGLAQLAPGETGEAVLARADKALYEAKGAGRDRVVCAPSPNDPRVSWLAGTTHLSRN